MFNRIQGIVDRFNDVAIMINDQGVIADQERWIKLMKEHSDLMPLVEKFNEYRAAQETIKESLAMLEEESDEEIREMAKEELNNAKESVAKAEEEMKVLLLPKDPNDDKNVILEVRAGAGGEEAAE